jgi:hypothetical protein
MGPAPRILRPEEEEKLIEEKVQKHGLVVCVVVFGGCFSHAGSMDGLDSRRQPLSLSLLGVCDPCCYQTADLVCIMLHRASLFPHTQPPPLPSLPLHCLAPQHHTHP